jgi:spore germination protein (amino acid permease)/Ger(x)C family germination protein
MFSDNEKISLRQFKRIIVFDLFSISGLIIPRIAVDFAGRDGFSAIILGTIITLIYAAIIIFITKNLNENFMDYSIHNAGRLITFIIGALYIIKLFACCVFATRLFGEVINETLLVDTDPRLIIIMLLLISAYAASKGFEVRARIVEVLYFIVIVPLLIFLILGLRDADMSNLMPIFTERPVDIVTGGYAVFLTFSLLELILFTAPFIQVSKTNVSKERSIFSYVVQALIIGGIMDILLFIITVGILGMEETKEKIWSTVSIIQLIKLPGGFIQRHDALIISLWMLSIFTIISGFIFYISYISKKIFHVSTQNYLIIPIIILIFGASVIPMDAEKNYEYFGKYMMFIGIPQSIILPLLVVLIGKLRKMSNAKAVARSILILATLFTTISLTGCGDMTEIEDRNFVQAMGIDLEGEEIKVYYVMPDLEAITGQSTKDSEKLIVELKGKDFFEIEDEYQLQSSKRLDFRHIKAIVLGKDLAENSKQLDELLYYIENNYELARNTLVYLSEKNAKEIISLNGNVSGGIGQYLERLYRINLINIGKTEVSIGDLIYGKNSDNLIIKVPILRPHEKSVENIGLAVFDESKLVYELNERESDYINIAHGYGKNVRIYIRDEEEDKPEYVIRIINVSRSAEFYWDNGKPRMVFNISGSGLVEKGTKDTKGITGAANDKYILEIQSLCNKQIKGKVTRLFDKIMKEENIDILNLYRMTSYKNKDMWLEYEQKEEQFIQDLEYTVEVDMKLK